MRPLFLLALAVSARAQVAPSVFLKNSEIYVVTHGSSDARQLTEDGRQKGLLVQTKDGSRFAFVRETPGSMLADIVVMQADGKIVREILFRPVEANVSGMRYVEHLEWMNNGRLVASGSVNPSTAEYGNRCQYGQRVAGVLGRRFCVGRFTRRSARGLCGICSALHAGGKPASAILHRR